MIEHHDLVIKILKNIQKEKEKGLGRVLNNYIKPDDMEKTEFDEIMDFIYENNWIDCKTTRDVKIGKDSEFKAIFGLSEEGKTLLENEKE